MMRLLWIAPYLGLLLTGCNTTILVASGKEFSDYQKAIKPYIEYWEKPGMTREERVKDSRACDGASDGPGWTEQTVRLNAANRPGETEKEAATRLRHEWQRCMLKTGYRYTGKCYDNEVGRAAPACAGRVLEPLR